ncbi:MAG: hypothetical protein K8R21_08070 [Leptospira sp.]|nr:hypothetical protein [Leptospira sp.]
MDSTLRELFFANTDEKSFRSKLPGFLAKFIATVGGNCGLVVLLSESGDLLEEAAAIGYGEDGFYYNFMTRGGGNFERVEGSGSPVLFMASEAEVFHQSSQSLLVQRILSRNKMAGFLLVEMPMDFRDEILLLVGFLASRISGIIDSKSGHSGGPGEVPVNKKREGFVAVEFLINSNPVLRQGIEEWDVASPLLISGPPGSGKKSLARYLCEKNLLKGQMVLISSLPDQLIKMEKSLEVWRGMARNGMIVFDKMSGLSIGQQRLFYEFLLDRKSESQLVFIDDNGKKEEIYLPFWDILSKNVLNLPGVSNLPKSELTELIRQLFSDLCRKYNRTGLNLTPSSLDKLKYMSFPGNLADLTNILEYSILQSTGSEIREQDIIQNTEKGFQAIGIQDSEELDLRKCVEALERQKILLASRLFSGNQIRMAKAMGISRGSLQYKMKQMGL